MDLRLREITWIRLLSLLAWTILVMIKRGISQLIEVIEARVFVVGDQVAEERFQEGEVEGKTLLPPLSDELVLERVWPHLHKRVNISVLWRLRRVNRAWKVKVGTTLEWAALEMVRLDSPGFLRLVADRCEPRPSLRERVEREMESFSVLLAEHLEDFVGQPSSEQSRGVCREPAWRKEEFYPSEKLASKSEIERLSSCRGCDAATCVAQEEMLNRGRREFNWSEEELESCASSTDESMRVYYPRHRMREM